MSAYILKTPYCLFYSITSAAGMRKCCGWKGVTMLLRWVLRHKNESTCQNDKTMYWNKSTSVFGCWKFSATTTILCYWILLYWICRDVAAVRLSLHFKLYVYAIWWWHVCQTCFSKWRINGVSGGIQYWNIGTKKKNEKKLGHFLDKPSLYLSQHF